MSAFACFREKALIGKPAKITFVEKRLLSGKGFVFIYGTQHTQPSPRFIHCENSSSCLRFRCVLWTCKALLVLQPWSDVYKLGMLSLLRLSFIVEILQVALNKCVRFKCLFPREGFSRQTYLSHLRPKKDAGNGNDLVFAQPTNGSVATCWHIELCRHVALQEWPGQRKALVKPQQKPGEPG